MYVKSEQARNVQIYRILGKAATIAACSYRHRIGRCGAYYTAPSSCARRHEADR